MLQQLTIRNYAIVDQLDIEFSAGLTAVTGETGAGKSIILGALGLTLGDRSDRDAVRDGSSRADISARFDTTRLPGARQWLTEQALDSPEEPDVCLLRRTVNVEGRSRAWINGIAVNLQSLKTIGEMLIDIHSQHEHQSLLNRNAHQRLLDDYAGQQEPARELRRISQQWRRLGQELQAIEEQADAESAQHQLIRYQVNELDELALQEGELEQLEAEYRRLNNADHVLADAQAVLDLCSESEEHNLLSGLNRALSLIPAEQDAGPWAESVSEMLGSARIQVEEAARELRRHIDDFERDPERLEAVNQRLAHIHQLARKHRVAPEQLQLHHAQLQEQLGDGTRNEEKCEALREQMQSLSTDYEQKASALSRARQHAAVKLAKQINQQLNTLGMADAQLKVQLEADPSDQLPPGGREQIEFLVSTNAGQTPRPLIKIASGGELSRISLAIQVITALTSETPTLVFDEVDVGIGGSVARSVGKLLRQLGERSQVLCVTHQPLVASLGHQHLFVSKKGDNGSGTGTRIQTLRQEQRVEEIARMLGGDADAADFSRESLAHAEELMAQPA